MTEQEWDNLGLLEKSRMWAVRLEDVPETVREQERQREIKRANRSFLEGLRLARLAALLGEN